MRLINTRTLQLEEFHDGNIPGYAILSHTWGTAEVTFQDMTSLGEAELCRKVGYAKIKQCCRQALEWGFRYAWIDTNCIDKSSSAELSEAINSMFRWYQASGACFAYLSDLFAVPTDEDFEESFARVRWFTRGWCLQELIAPRNLHFFNAAWKRIGSKYTLREMISKITCIEEIDLFSPDLSFIPVAKRMSWAASRETTRTEDMAYCLLGIFDVNMPLLYGEGTKAFIRLQEEIMRQVEDHSIFIWQAPRQLLASRRLGVLAKHPSSFFGAVDVELRPSARSEHYSVTSKGIRIQLPVIEHQRGNVAILDCYPANDPSKVFGLPLTPPVSDNSDVLARYPKDNLFIFDTEDIAKAKLQTMYLLKADTTTQSESQNLDRCWVRSFEMTCCGYKLSHVIPPVSWDMQQRTMSIRQWWSIIRTSLAFTSDDGKGFVIVLRLDPTNEKGTLSLVDLNLQAAAPPEQLESVLWAIQQTSEPRRSLDRISRNGDTISAKLDVLELRGKLLFVVDIQVC